MFDNFFDLLLGIRGAGVEVLGGKRHVGKGLGVGDHLGHVDHRADVDPAVTNEHADARRLGEYVALQRQMLYLDLGVAGLAQESLNDPCGARGLGYAFRDVLGRRRSPGNEHPVP